MDGIGYDRLARVRQTVEAGGEIGGGAGDRITGHILGIFRALPGDDDAAAGNADMNGKVPALLNAERRHCSMGLERGAHRPHGIVGMGDGSAEQRHDFVAHMAVHGTAMVLDNPVYGIEDKPHQFVKLFGVERIRKLGVTGKIGKKYGQLTTFTFGRRRRNDLRFEGRAITRKLLNRLQQTLAVAELLNSQVLEVVVRQLRKQVPIHPILVECGGMLL